MKTVKGMVSQAAAMTKLSNTACARDQFCAPKPWNKALMRINPFMVWRRLSGQSPLKLTANAVPSLQEEIRAVILSYWNNYFHDVLGCSVEVERAQLAAAVCVGRTRKPL